MCVRRLQAMLMATALVAGATGNAQQPQGAQELTGRADTAYMRQQWPEAEQLYSELAKASPENPRYLYRLGVSAEADQHHEQALAAFNQAKTKGSPAFIVDYDIAAVYAGMGQREKATAQLQTAVENGFAQPEKLIDGAEWGWLRSEAAFAGLLEHARRNKAPCEYTAENRQFDFWLGDWDVVATDSGTTQGSSHIARELNGCVIWENWQSTGMPYAGKSYNTFDAALKRWEQFWVDNAGGMVYFHGGLKEGVMDFWTDEIPQPDGTKAVRHLQFFNLSPDKVRQLSHISKDGGKNWSVEYDFTYNRKRS